MAEEQQEIKVKTVERELVVNAHASEVDIALLEDKILVELHKEKTNNQFAVGDVYLGIAAEPSVIIGSIAIVIPGNRRTPLPGVP